MDWQAIGSWVLSAAVPVVSLAITAALIAAWPQIHTLLELHVGKTRLATIESVLGAGVRLAEQTIPGTGLEKREFVIKWATTMLAGLKIVLPLNVIGDMLEAAYLKEKMAGLKLPTLVAVEPLALPVSTHVSQTAATVTGQMTGAVIGDMR